MSGGSYNYGCYQVQALYPGQMFDIELDKMMADLVEVLHDLEWWISGDMGEDDYRETVYEFKKKWFKRRKTDIQEMIDKAFEDTKQSLMESLEYLKGSEEEHA